MWAVLTKHQPVQGQSCHHPLPSLREVTKPIWASLPGYSCSVWQQLPPWAWTTPALSWPALLLSVISQPHRYAINAASQPCWDNSRWEDRFDIENNKMGDDELLSQRGAHSWTCMILPGTWPPWDFNPPGLTSYLVFFEETVHGCDLEIQLSLKEQNDLLQLRDCVRKNSNIKPYLWLKGCT